MNPSKLDVTFDFSFVGYLTKEETNTAFKNLEKLLLNALTDFSLQNNVSTGPAELVMKEHRE